MQGEDVDVLADMDDLSGQSPSRVTLKDKVIPSTDIAPVSLCVP